MDNERFQRLFDTAFKNMNAGSYKEALDIFDTLQEAAPDNPAVLFQKIQCLKLSCNVEQTIAECDNYLRQFGENEQIYIWKGNAYYELEDYKRAINNYDIALKINPNNSVAHNDKGMVYSDLKEHAKALHHFNMAIEQNPNYSNSHNNRARTMEFFNVPIEESLQDLETAIKLNPHNTVAISNFVETHIKLKNYEKALELTQNTEYNAILQVLRGFAYYFLEDKDNAVKCIAPNFAYIKAELVTLNQDLAEIKRLISTNPENNCLVQKEEAIERLITAGNYLVEKINEQTIGTCQFCDGIVTSSMRYVNKDDIFICEHCINICNEIMQEQNSSLNYLAKEPNKEFTQESDIICSFCARERSETEHIVSAKNEFFICNGCVGVCNNVLKNNSDFDSEYEKAIENAPIDMVAKTPNDSIEQTRATQKVSFLKFLNKSFIVLKTIILIVLIAVILYAKFYRIHKHSQHYKAPQSVSVIHTSMRQSD